MRFETKIYDIDYNEELFFQQIMSGELIIQNSYDLNNVIDCGDLVCEECAFGRIDTGNCTITDLDVTQEFQNLYPEYFI